MLHPPKEGDQKKSVQYFINAHEYFEKSVQGPNVLFESVTKGRAGAYRRSLRGETPKGLPATVGLSRMLAVQKAALSIHEVCTR